MYVIRAEVTVAAGRVNDVDAWATRRSEHLKAQKGFQQWLGLQSLGYPARRTAFAVWDSRDSFLAWVRSPELQAFAQANPTEGLFTLTGPQRAYEVIHDVGNMDQAKGVALVDWTLKARGIWTAFADSRKEVFDLRVKHMKGNVGGRLLLFLGDPRRALVINGFANIDDMGGGDAVRVPERQEFDRTHSESDYTSEPRGIEAYEVVQIS